MLVVLWSPKGGSGTSVFAAACALRWLGGRRGAPRRSRRRPAGGPRAARPDPRRPACATGCGVGVEAPADALERLAVARRARADVAARRAGRSRDRAAGGGRGARVSRCASDGADVVDVGRADERRRASARRVADATVVVLRGAISRCGARCACRRLCRRGRRGRLIEEPGRALGARDVADVLGVPVLATVPVRSSIARVVDAGVLAARLPDSRWRSPLRDVLRPHRRASGREGTRLRDRTRHRLADRALRDSVHRRLLAVAVRSGAAVGPRRTAGPARAACCATRRRLPSGATAARRARRRWSTRSAASVRSSRCSPTRRSPRSWSTARAAPTSSGRGRVERGRPRRSTPTIARLAERIVAPLGLRLDRSSPIVDARLADGSRAARGAPAARARRAVPHDPPLRDAAPSALDAFGVDGARPRLPRRGGARRLEPPGRGRDELGQDHAAATRWLGRSTRASASSRSRRPPSCALAAAARRAARSAARQRRRRRRGRGARSRAHRAAHATRPPRSSARSAAARRSTCCRRSTPVTTARSRRCTPTAPPTRCAGSRRSRCSAGSRCRWPRSRASSRPRSTRSCTSRAARDGRREIVAVAEVDAPVRAHGAVAGRVARPARGRGRPGRDPPGAPDVDLGRECGRDDALARAVGSGRERVARARSHAGTPCSIACDVRTGRACRRGWTLRARADARRRRRSKRRPSRSCSCGAARAGCRRSSASRSARCICALAGVAAVASVARWCCHALRHRRSRARHRRGSRRAGASRRRTARRRHRRERDRLARGDGSGPARRATSRAAQARVAARRALPDALQAWAGERRRPVLAPSPARWRWRTPIGGRGGRRARQPRRVAARPARASSPRPTRSRRRRGTRRSSSVLGAARATSVSRWSSTAARSTRCIGTTVGRFCAVAGLALEGARRMVDAAGPRRADPRRDRDRCSPLAWGVARGRRGARPLRAGSP